MSRLRVHNLTISLDGYAAGPGQSLDDPLGIGGEQLHEWLFATRFGRQMAGEEDGETGLDDDRARAGDDGIGATIMGRNMFGPIRGGWGDATWDGWWGPDPPFHHPVFVLTHHPHDPIPMEGGTTFYFVTDGPESALAQATEAAGSRDVLIGGGAATVRQYLEAGLIDELHVAVVPVLLGGGARLFEGAYPYRSVEQVNAPAVTHIRLAKIS